MYLSHFGLNEPPFRITPHTEFFFEGAKRGATLDALLYAIQHEEGIVKVTGEVGSGKTMLCRVLVERLPGHVETIYLANPSLSRDEILHVIAADLQVESRGERVTILLRSLQEKLIKLYAAGKRVVVLIDEAHAMPLETLEEIRLLSNLESNRHKLLQIVLFGQPELDDHLALPNMRQLKERITHGFRLEPLVRSDIESYIDFRMRAAGYRGPNVFAPAAMRLIAQASEGLTRRINILADKSLLAAFAAGSHQVTPAHARAAIKDAEFGRRGTLRWEWVAATAVACLALAAAFFGYHFFAARSAPTATGPVQGMPQRLPPELHAPADSSSVRAPTGPAQVASAEPASEGARPASDAPRSAADAAAPAAPEFADISSAAQGAEAPQQHSQVASARATPPLSASPTAPTTARLTEPPTAPYVAPALAADTKPPPPLAPPRGPVPPTGKLSAERFEATQAFLAAPTSVGYTIQLLTVKAADTPVLENFLRQAADLGRIEDTYVYGFKIDGAQYYAATYGLYPTVAETVAAIEALPASFRTRSPYHRSIALMRRQNQE